jgi:single-strand DNA-binding protein
MSGDTPITIVGNLVADAEVRFTAQGQPVATFRVASVPRFYDKAAGEWKDGDALFLAVNVWKQQAEHCAESLLKGTRVVVTGRLRQRSYETKEGDKRTVLEVEADDVAVSLKFATAKVAKAARSSTPGGPGGQGSSGGGRQEDPWASDSGGYSDEPPF